MLANQTPTFRAWSVTSRDRETLYDELGSVSISGRALLMADATSARPEWVRLDVTAKDDPTRLRFAELLQRNTGKRPFRPRVVLGAKLDPGTSVWFDFERMGVVAASGDVFTLEVWNGREIDERPSGCPPIIKSTRLSQEKGRRP